MTYGNMAVFYRPDDYDPTISRIYGRVSANTGLLKGLIQYGRRSSLAFYVEAETHFAELQRRFSSYLQSSTKIINPIFHGDIISLNQAGVYVMTDPSLSPAAWARGVISPDAYSVCGLTHSFSSLSVIEEIEKIIIAPLQPWDAMVCSSAAVKKAVQAIFEQWYAYLKKYRNLDYQSPLQLPVVPLGIHVNEVSDIEQKPAMRKKMREKWGIKENDFVVLFYGRLSYYEKSHPVPMYLALEALANRIKKEDTIYCLQVGWFPKEEDFASYKESIKQFSPSIKPLFLLHPDSTTKLTMWSISDVFISLVDNIQESFGLTPLEAMANELPVVVSDWSGYQETVRHGIDGFRIPSILPPFGCGKDLGLGYLANAINYHTYCGLSAQHTAIDIRRCTEALWQLYSSAELRYRMGASGRQHVINQFDWKQIIKQHDALWDVLTERRLHAQSKNAAPITESPMLADPCLTYSSYSTHTLNAVHSLSLSRFAHQKLNDIHQNELCLFGWQQRLSQPLLLAILDKINQQKTQTVEQIVNFITLLDATISSGTIVRSLTYLIKYDILHYE